MKAQETNLEAILEGKKQYQVPMFQRLYSWGHDQIDQLWDDIIEIAETRRTSPHATHFIGSLVLATSPDNGPVGPQHFLVIDGQQRLTTLSLLLAALRDHMVSEGKEDARDELNNQYLLNPYDVGRPPKLLPTQADQPAYLAVLHHAPTAGGMDKVGAVYRTFRAKLNAVTELDPVPTMLELQHAILNGLSLVVVTAEPSDNAHRIFESLNNTGLSLTQADLLKNYLFMRLGKRSDSVYETVWLPLEKNLSSENLELLFWLDLVQTDERAKQSEMYVGQQRRLERLESPEQIEEEVRRIAGLGPLLASILDPSLEPDPALRHRLNRIKLWGTTTAYPLVLQLLSRRAAGTVTTEQVCAALLVLESYFVRRIVIGRATAGLNRTLLQAVQEVASSDDVVEGLRRFLSRGRRYFASDEEIHAAVTSVSFYWQGRASQKKLILQWLEESYGSKEPVSPAKLTIEHIMPQTLSPEWRADLRKALGEGADVDAAHSQWAQTLGNMTLTGYNSELGNSVFSVKRQKFSESGLHLNQEIAGSTSWGPAEIQARADKLADRIVELWPGPEPGVEPDDDESLAWSMVRSILAEIPSGRWTSYGAVAQVAGTSAIAVGTYLSSHRMDNDYRVLQATGTIAPGFKWTTPERTDSPQEILMSEGVEFDAAGRASHLQELNAEELAKLTGVLIPEAEEDA